MTTATAPHELAFYDIRTGAALRGTFSLVDGQDLHRLGAAIGDHFELRVCGGRIPAGKLGWMQLRVAVGVCRRGEDKPCRRPSDAEFRAVRRLYSKVTLQEDRGTSEHALVRHLIQPLNP